MGEKDTMYYGIGEVVGHKIISLGGWEKEIWETKFSTRRTETMKWRMHIGMRNKESTGTIQLSIFLKLFCILTNFMNTASYGKAITVIKLKFKSSLFLFLFV